MPAGTSVQVQNLTENAVSLSGGNRQTIQVESKDVSPEGEFSVDFQVSAIQRGNFSVSFDLNKPERIATPKPVKDSFWSDIDLLKKPGL